MHLPNSSRERVCADVHVLQYSGGTYNQQLITTHWESLPQHKSMGKIIANTLGID